MLPKTIFQPLLFYHESRRIRTRSWQSLVWIRSEKSAQVKNVQIHFNWRFVQNCVQFVLLTDPVFPPAKRVGGSSQVRLPGVITSYCSWIPERQVFELVRVTGNPLPIALFRIDDSSKTHFLHLLDGFGNASHRSFLRGGIRRLQPQARRQLTARARLNIDRKETEVSPFGTERGKRLANLAGPVHWRSKIQVAITGCQQPGALGAAELHARMAVAVDSTPAADNDESVALLLDVLEILQSGFARRRRNVNSPAIGPFRSRYGFCRCRNCCRRFGRRCWQLGGASHQTNRKLEGNADGNWKRA